MTRPDVKWLWLALAGVAVVLGFVYVPGFWSTYQRQQLAALSPTQLTERLRRQPADLDARYQLGSIYAKQGQQSEAIREYLTVIQQDPTRADVLNDLAVSYMLTQRFYEALVALQGALVAQPDYPAALANLGRLHLATKMPYSAVRELERAAKFDPKNPDLLCDLGEAYQRTLNLNSALAIFERVAREHPSNSRALIGAGRAYYSLADYEHAEPLLQRAMKLSPDDATPPLLLGRILLERGGGSTEQAAAKKLLENAVTLDPQEAEAWYDLGRVMMNSGDLKAAIRHFGQALALSPEHPGATYQIARALRAEGRAEDATRVERTLRNLSLRSREISRLEEVLNTNPRDWQACGQLVELYLRAGNAGMASLYLRQLENGSPSDSQLPKLRAAYATLESQVSGRGKAQVSTPSADAHAARPPQSSAISPGTGAK